MAPNSNDIENVIAEDDDFLDNDLKPVNATKSDSNDTTIRHSNRDSFFSFIPEIVGFGCNVAKGEVGHFAKGVKAAPSFTKNFIADSITYYKENPKTLFDEVISGFTVAIMQVPESIAFSFVAGVPPLSGLQATFWMATITGILGGKPGMISGAAGALAVVVDQLTIDTGVLQYLSRAERLNVLYMTMFVCGVIQILFAWFRLAKVVKLIPETGMIGFMNGLAIIIFMAQLTAFQKCDVEGIDLFVECKVSEREWLNFSDDTWPLIFTLIQVAITMFIMQFFSKIPKIGKIIPSSLVALLFGTAIEHWLIRAVFDSATRTVGQTSKMSGELPKFDWPTVPTGPTDADYSNTISVIFTYGLVLAAIGGVESVLTLQACNEITDTVPKVSDCNQELFAQGLANLVCGMFRAMGGDAMIGQSTINIMNGARHRVSSTFSGLFMLLFIVAISKFIELVPVPTLTGVLFMIVLNTFQWQTFTILRYGRLSDSAVIIIVTAIAVVYNLAVGILIGIVFSALSYAWDSGSFISSDTERKNMIINGETIEVKYVKIRGTLFFGSARQFISYFNVANDPSVIVLDLEDCIIVDHTAVAAIGGVTHRFKQQDKKVLLLNVPNKCQGRLYRTGDHDSLRGQLKTPTDLMPMKGIQQDAMAKIPSLHTPAIPMEQQLIDIQTDQGEIIILDPTKEQ